eukprot:RCo043290
MALESSAFRRALPAAQLPPPKMALPQPFFSGLPCGPSVLLKWYTGSAFVACSLVIGEFLSAAPCRVCFETSCFGNACDIFSPGQGIVLSPTGHPSKSQLARIYFNVFVLYGRIEENFLGC